MTHSSKSKTWANDDQMVNPVPDSIHSREELVDAGHSTDEPSSSQRKKAKVDEPNETSQVPKIASSALKPGHETLPVATVAGESECPIEDAMEQKEQDAPAAPEADVGPVSDADWLRSKTSRLLGLLDEDEQEEYNATSQHKAAAPTETGTGADIDSRVSEVQNIVSQDDDAGVAAETPETDTNVDLIRASARLFVRNLPYNTAEVDLEPIFTPFGKIEEIHIAFDTRHTTSKGFAYVQYVDANSAVNAYKEIDGLNFQGRLLHILPASAKKTYKIDEYELSKLPLKKQKQIKRRLESTSSTFNWNSLYMNTDAVMSSVAERLGVSKAELLDPTSSDAAVKQAHAETHVIQETKAYFASNGVNLDSFKQRERGNTAILVKNFSFGVKASDLRNMFEPYGQITKLLMPPSGTIAIVEFARPDEAQKAFKSLAYRKLGDSILFLEKAPKDLFDPAAAAKQNAPESKPVSQGFSTTDTFAADEPEEDLLTSTLFVKNLSFSTTTERLIETFRPLDGFLSAKIKTKPDPKRPGQTLSMGFGFVEFKTKAQAQAALAAMNGYNLDQHELVIKASNKAMDAAEERRKEDTAKKIAARRTKIIIKNLPFQATKKDIRSLFGSYGQLRSVRVPKKFDRTARGFAFADFVSAREAENAMDALKNTHFLGRKLVLEFANAEAIDPEEEIEKLEKKVGQQLDRVKLQKLTGTGRKKFTMGAQDDEEA
ncbi:Multiple RNA-binding domain-containing protein1 [Monascus purpureus]|nr:Multiple RNA-binding domain-containing protein1 [Monascus purpureus]